MSDPIYHFEPAETLQAGHALKEKVTAVYALTGFIERRYRNGENGETTPYWAYVERGGRETGIESTVSAEALQSKLAGGETAPAAKPDAQKCETATIGRLQRLFIGLNRQDGEPVAKETVLSLLEKRLEAFTVTEVTGFYRGEREPTLIVEVARNGGTGLEPLARDLADAFDQDAVGLEKDGSYTRVFGERERRKAQLNTQDREKLKQFTRNTKAGCS
ncbi:MAG: hypothetical protein ACLFUF_07415, partial [Opitutales bacterium]